MRGVPVCKVYGMPPRRPTTYAVWLTPAPYDQRLVNAVIRDLAVLRGGTAFEAHVTLCSGESDVGKEALIASLRALAGVLRALTIDLGRLDGTADFFALLFARMALPEDLLPRAAAAFPGSHPPGAGPHLSLLYGEPARRPVRSASETSIAARLPAVVHFDRLTLVSPMSGDWRDLTRWRTLAREPLGRHPAR